MLIRKIFLCFAFCAAFLTACKKEVYDDVSFVQTAITANKLAALFTITQDNSGRVTITPNAEGGTQFEIYFGDGTTTPAKVAAGGSVQRTYKEGVYDVKIVAKNIAGQSTEAIQKLTVAFRAPENVEATIGVDPGNNFKLNVSAKALYETYFQVFFGDIANEIPTSFMEGETVTHTYTATGTYNVRVVALSGGAATTTVTKEVVIRNPVVLPLDFESATLQYNFANFDGGNSTLIDNPQKNGINTSNKVVRMVKSAGQPWGGSVIPLGENINFANKIFRMKVFSPRIGAKVTLKVENAVNGNLNFEKEATLTVANQWEDLVFNFSDINTANNYNNIVIFFDLGTMGDGSANFTFLYDDIRLVNSIPSNQINLPVTFDVPGINYTVTDFGNNQTVDGVDPQNANNKIKVTTKPNGAETWAGTTIGTPTGFASKIPFTASNSKMSVRIMSPAAGLTIRLKAEDVADGTKAVETDAVTTKANEWETLVFDFSKQVNGTPALNLNTNYAKLSIFFDFGTGGSGKVFRWDDVEMFAGQSLVLPLNFESSAITYNITNFDGGDVTVIDNPNKSGINTSNRVGRMIKNNGQPWGGSFITLDAPINFTGASTMKIKVHSPRAGAKLLLKVENLTDGGINFERELSISKANEWEELTFDYSAIDRSKSYQKVVLIFDLGTRGDGSANYTFYFDDIIVQ